MQALAPPQGPLRSTGTSQQVDLDSLVRNASLLTPDLIAILSELTTDGALSKTSELSIQVWQIPTLLRSGIVRFFWFFLAEGISHIVLVSASIVDPSLPEPIKYSPRSDKATSRHRTHPSTAGGETQSIVGKIEAEKARIGPKRCNYRNRMLTWYISLCLVSFWRNISPWSC
jgi:hypothetical protein